jgi:hypothetical protein
LSPGVGVLRHVWVLGLILRDDAAKGGLERADGTENATYSNEINTLSQRPMSLLDNAK